MACRSGSCDLPGGAAGEPDGTHPDCAEHDERTSLALKVRAYVVVVLDPTRDLPTSCPVCYVDPGAARHARSCPVPVALDEALHPTP